MKVLFITVNGFLMIINFADAEYFKFINKRTTADIFSWIGSGNDFINLLPQYIIDYWYILVSCISVIIFAWFTYPRLNPSKYSQSNKPGIMKAFQFLFIPIILFLCVIGIRGTSLRPLGVINAAKYTDSQYIPLVLNTSFTLYKTFLDTDLSEKEYFTDSELVKYFNPVLSFQPTTKPKTDNVVIIILEGFAKEYIGSLNKSIGHTFFLDSIIYKGRSFTNAFANGTQSIQAMPAILSALPSLMDESFVSSQYSSSDITSLAKVLNKHGYTSAFFHGGNKGTMAFDNFAILTGIEKYYGRKEFNNDEFYDGKWGIFDEEFLQFCANKMNTFDKPFLSVIFTLSSHHPYTIPDHRKHLFKKDWSEIQTSIEYTDYALKQFFDRVSKMPWYKNTLFVITADHSTFCVRPLHKTNVGRYAIPITFFHPGDSSLTGFDDMYTQQADITPSIIDYLDFEENIISFGRSVFDEKSDHFAINYNNNIYQLVENGYVLLFDGDNSLGLYNYNKDNLLKDNLIYKEQEIMESMEDKIMGIIQTYNNRMINNNMIYKE